MSATTGASGRLLSALAAILFLAFALPAPAEAQTPGFGALPAEKFLIAPGGVDLRTGRYGYSETDLTGGGGQGALALTRIMPERVGNHPNPFGNFSHNWDIFLIETMPRLPEHLVGSGSEAEFTVRMNVHRGGRSLTFETNGATNGGYSFRSDGENAFLTFTGAKFGADSIYTMRGPDGTVMVFRRLGDATQGADCASQLWSNNLWRRCAFISELTEPDGTKYSFDYVSAGIGTLVRLSRVISSRGYALLMEGSGSLVARACILNLALAPAPAPGASCPAGALATASYGYSDGKLVSAAPAGGGASTFTYGPGSTMGFVKPGQSTPWLTNTIELREDEQWAMQEIVTHQAFADGQAYTYGYGTTETTPDQPHSSIAGGEYTDAESRKTVVQFGFPKKPGSEPMPEQPCMQRPCNDPAPNDFPNPVYQRTPGPELIIDPLGRSTVMDYCDPVVKAGLPAWETNRCEVIPLHTSTDPEGIRTKYEYDGHGNLRKTTRYPKPGVLNPDGSTPAPIVVEAAFDFLNIKSQTKPLWVRDAKGNETRWTYAPEHGGVRTETGPAVNGVTPQKRYFYVQRYARLADGNLAGPAIWLLDRMSFCRTGNPSGDGCALGAADEVVTLYDYGPDSGPTNLLLRGQSVTADGEVLRTCYAYDSLGRKISETSPNGTAGLSSCPVAAPATALPYTTSTRYDAEGRVTGTIASDPDGPGGHPIPAVRNSYDSAGRLIRVEQGSLEAWQPEGVAPALWPGFSDYKVVHTSYDALDRKTRESVGGYGIVSAVTEYGYDLGGRLKCTAVRMNPDVWATPLPDKCVPGPAHPVHGADRISRNVYDAAGQPVEARDGVGTPLERREAAYTYNGNGQKLSLTDARGYKAEMTYDGFGRQSRWVFPSKTTPGVADQGDYEQYGYDPNGNRTSLRKRDGAVLTYFYDALNRLVEKRVPGNGGNVAYAYDLRGLQLSANFTILGGGVTNAWDGFGRMTSTTTHMGGSVRTVAHRYDRDGADVEITFPDGHKFWTARDGLGRMKGTYRGALGDPSVRMTVSYYDRASNLYYFGRGSGTSTYTEFDEIGRPRRVYEQFGHSAGDTNSTFAYNPAGQLRSEARNNDSYAWKESAALNRPFSANGQNQYDSVDSASFAYDLNGNLKSDGTTNYEYDFENRLVSASGTLADSKNATLTYDPLGRLFQISSPATGTTQFLYDGDQLVAEYNGAGTMLRRYVHGDGNDDPLYGFEGAGLDQPRYPHVDRQGSVIAVAGPNAALLAINTYDEYGIPGKAQREASALGTHGRFQYTGQAWLPELGMYYYKARIYSPVLGRFLQTDPIGYDGGINLYNYADADPLNYTDPSGNHPIAVGLAIRCALNAGCRTAVGNGIRAVGNGLRRLAPAVRLVPPDRVLSESKPQEHGNSPAGDRRDENRTPAPALEGDPYSPAEVDKRRSRTREEEGAPSKDPDSQIPDRGPGRDQGGHGARGRTPHKTGERNVNPNEEHSRRPKGNPSGSPR